MKEWFKKNKKAILTGTTIVLGIGAGFVLAKGVVKLIDIQREKMMEIVTNNLKLAKDGEFVDMYLRTRTNDTTRSIISKRWVKKDGVIVYLGKVIETKPLTEAEMIVRQINKLTNTVDQAVKNISNAQKT